MLGVRPAVFSTRSERSSRLSYLTLPYRWMPRARDSHRSRRKYAQGKREILLYASESMHAMPVPDDAICWTNGERVSHAACAPVHRLPQAVLLHQLAEAYLADYDAVQLARTCKSLLHALRRYSIKWHMPASIAVAQFDDGTGGERKCHRLTRTAQRIGILRHVAAIVTVAWDRLTESCGRLPSSVTSLHVCRPMTLDHLPPMLRTRHSISRLTWSLAV